MLRLAPPAPSLELLPLPSGTLRSTCTIVSCTIGAVKHASLRSMSLWPMLRRLAMLSEMRSRFCISPSWVKQAAAIDYVNGTNARRLCIPTRTSPILLQPDLHLSYCSFPSSFFSFPCRSLVDFITLLSQSIFQFLLFRQYFLSHSDLSHLHSLYSISPHSLPPL